ARVETAELGIILFGNVAPALSRREPTKSRLYVRFPHRPIEPQLIQLQPRLRLQRCPFCRRDLQRRAIDVEISHPPFPPQRLSSRCTRLIRLDAALPRRRR